MIGLFNLINHNMKGNERALFDTFLINLIKLIFFAIFAIRQFKNMY